MPEMCVVFDLDDTLYLERDYVRSGFEHVGTYVEKKLGIKQFAGRAWDLFLAGHRGRIFDELLREENQHDQAIIATLVSIYRSHLPQISLLPDALRCLNILHEKFPLAVITDGPVNSQRNKATALQLDKWFGRVLLTEELGEGYRKPSASAFRMIQEQSGLNGAQFYYVADNPSKDFHAPRKLGWKTIRVRRREGLHAAVEANGEWGPDIEMEDLSEIPNLLKLDNGRMTSVPGSVSTPPLAIEGGEPIRRTPFNPWPKFEADEIEAATAVLQSGRVNYWTGEEGRRFEAEFAASAGCKYGIALANGTVALELALMTLGIGEGDEVIVPSRTFIATASCTVMRGAKPVVADVDPISQNITAGTIRPLLTRNTKAIIVVHLAGWPCDMDPILELAREHGLKVIEDCAQSTGATYKGRAVGSLGDVAAFSFCQDKIMTTAGEGGMLTTNQEDLWNRAWSYKDHGKSYQAVYQREHAPGFRWLHESFGTNWRLTEIQSALGRVVLSKIPQMVEQRRRNADVLAKAFQTHEALRVTSPPENIYHSYYKYYVFVRPERLRDGWTRDRICLAINGEGIPCFTGSCSEIYLEKAFPDAMRPIQRWAVAKELGETSLMFLVHPTLSEADMHDICRAVSKVLDIASAPQG